MAGRIRTMKPEILDDEKTAGLSDAEFRMFQGIILLADDHGSFRANARWLASQIWWSREPSQDPRECLARLSRLSLVTLYEHSGQVYGHVTNWERHQKIDHPSKPRLPQVDDEESCVITLGCESSVSECATDSRESRELFGDSSRDSRLTSDLRPPISDLRSPPGGADAPAHDLGTGEPFQVLTLTEPDQPKKKRAASKQVPVKPPSPRALTWKLWRDMYQTSRRGYGKYVENPASGSAINTIAERALSEAISELTDRGQPGADPDPMVEEILRHWFASFLRDDGHNDFLTTKRHAVEYLLKSLSEYGLPKGWGQAAKSNARAAIAQIGGGFE